MKGLFSPLKLSLALAFILLLGTGYLSGVTHNKATFLVNSYAPGGTAAFLELLKKSGYKVEVEQFSELRLHPGDLEIAFSPDFTADDYSDLQSHHSNSDSASWNGANYLSLHFPQDDEISLDTPQFYSAFFVGQSNPYTVAFVKTGFLEFSDLTVSYPIVALDKLRSSPLFNAAVLNSKRGTMFAIGPAEMACNQYLPFAGNASLLLQIIQRMAPSKRIVINEMFVRTSSPTILEAIGPWSETAWNETLIFLILGALVLAIRFGLPSQSGTYQASGSSFIGALATLFRVMRKPKGTAEVILYSYDKKVRSAFNIGTLASGTQRNQALPPALASALSRLEWLLQQKAKPHELLVAIQSLEREYEAATQANLPHPMRRRLKAR